MISKKQEYNVSGRQILYEDKFCTIFSAKPDDISNGYFKPNLLIRSYSNFYGVYTINIGKGIDVPVMDIKGRADMKMYPLSIDAMLLVMRLTKGAAHFLIQQKIFKITKQKFSYEDFNKKDILIAYHYRIISEGCNDKFTDFLSNFPFSYDDEIFKYPVDQLINDEVITILYLHAWMADFEILNKECIDPFDYKHCFEIVLGPTKMEFQSIILTNAYDFLADPKIKAMKTGTLDENFVAINKIPIRWGFIHYYINLFNNEKFRLIYNYSDPKYEYATLFLLQSMNYFEELTGNIYHKRFQSYYDKFYEAFMKTRSSRSSDLLHLDPNKAQELFDFINKLPKEFYRSETVKKIVMNLRFEIYP